MADVKDRMNIYESCTAEDFSGCSGYISDAISELADSGVSVYYNDIDDFAAKNPEMLARVIKEGLAPDASEYFAGNAYGDFLSYTRAVAQAAWFLTIEEELYEDIDELVIYAVYDALLDNGIDTIDDSVADEIEMLNGHDFETFDDIESYALRIAGADDE